MITTFETAKVGDRAWSVLYGWGEVSEVSEGSAYPLMVLFPAGIKRWYTFEGKQFKNHVTRSLFWDEVKIEAPQKPLPDLEVDTKVLVWNHPNEKRRGHFSHFDENGRIYVFQYGRTSFTKATTCSWEYWKLVE